MSATAIDEAKLEQFMNQFVGDLGAAITAPLVLIGDKLGLYKAMADSEPVTSAQLAERTNCNERYIREWLCQQAASGYVEYDAAETTFRLPPEQAMALADENSPAFIPGAFQLVAAVVKDEPHIAERFRSGEGFGWHEHHQDLFAGTERFFRPGYLANLVASWLPALDGVVEKLTAGARVADIGCGHGASTILMAKAFPASRFVGSDYHEGSIAAARKAAERSGVADRVSFEVSSAKDFGGGPFDLVCVFDALHDMGDPVGASHHVREQLADDGTWMVVEPSAGDATEENMNPVGRIFYGGSTMLCTPASLSQEVGLALGAQAGEKRLTEVLNEGGFSRVRRAAETPFNIVLRRGRNVLGSALAHPTVFVRDLDRARAFYETLGLTVSAEVSTGIFMTAGNGTIFPLIHRADATPPSHTIAAFQVDDLPGAVASLRARGVAFEEYDSPGLRTIDGIADMGDYHAAWLKDPDGNFIGIHEPPR